MDAAARQRRYGDDVPWDQGDATVEAFLKMRAAETGIDVDEARDAAQYTRGGSRDSNDYTFDQAHMARAMGFI